MTERCSPDPSKRPFAAAPDPDRYFPAGVIEEARQRIGRCIEGGKGPALAVGSAGTGKTMLLEVLAEQFREQMSVVPLVGAQICTRRALLQMILFQLGLPYRGLDEGELRLSILHYLRTREEPSRRMLLLVDEADSLPTRLLEELRVLTNIVAEGRLLVSLVLIGNAILEERFAEPQMEAFSQRVSTRCYLAAMGREETFQYVRAQVAAADYNPDDLFTSDGLEAMFAATDGVPRLINQLGDQLVWMAQETGYTPLDGEIVQQAWSELQQLPAPWNASTSELTGEVVEFGELSQGDLSHDNPPDRDIQDDHPASIPIGSTRDIQPQAVETFDATQQLLDQLGQLDSADVNFEPEIALALPQAHNPFDESFDSEEVLFDQYSSFESQLLASAPRVINRTDTAFAQQLRQCEETVDLSVVNASPQLADAQPERTSDLGVAATFQPSIESSPAEDEDHVQVALQPRTSNNSSAVLLVEDEGRPNATIVPGQQFRRLFSSLESGSSLAGLG